MILVARRGALVLSVLLLASPVLAGEVDVMVVGAAQSAACLRWEPLGEPGGGGRSWSPANDGLAIRRANCCAFDPFDPETVVIGTYRGGFLKARWGYGTMSGKIN